MTWLEFAWNITLILLVACSLATLLLLWALPTTYSHFHPQYITEDDFLDPDKTEKLDNSAYAYFKKHKDADGRLRVDASVQIVVLGDIGRSPRMQYHALSIASHGGKVDFIGHVESEIPKAIRENPFIKVIGIKPLPQQLRSLPWILRAPFKILYEIFSLVRILGYQTAASRWMLVQNPPAIPTLMVCVPICFLRGTRLVIDWHNFAYSILALRFGPNHPLHFLVKISEWYERFITSHGVHTHFAVTNAMVKVLKTEWGIENALPLHDRPPELFQPLTSKQRALLLQRLPETSSQSREILSGHTRLIVSSTSWTPDEDFSILLDALIRYSASKKTNSNLPNILAIITGKGPQKDHYLSKIKSLTDSGQLQNITVKTAWLTIEDYALLLGSADLGVSLHTSSSGVDLPMKVVDMFGTGLPVAGWSDFAAWPELVQEGVNGRGFNSAQKLAEVLEELFADETKLRQLREGAMRETKRRWTDEWMPTAGKVFQLRP